MGGWDYKPEIPCLELLQPSTNLAAVRCRHQGECVALVEMQSFWGSSASRTRSVETSPSEVTVQEQRDVEAQEKALSFSAQLTGRWR